MKVLDRTISQLTLPTPFAVGDTHVYLIKGDMLTLVDAGVKTKAAWQALKIQLRELGYHPYDIEQIILTHHHPDHIGLVGEFPRVERIAAHENVQAWLTRDEAFLKHYLQFFKTFFKMCGIDDIEQSIFDEFKQMMSLAGEGEVTDVLNEGDILPGHGEWRVIETKGHAQSHLSFLREDDGILLGGDHILDHISSNPLLEPPKMGETHRPKPLLQYRTNLKKCLSLGISTVLPGHGLLVKNIDELIPKRLAKQDQRAAKVLALLEKRPLTPFQICQEIFPTRYRSQLDLTMSETIGQLDLLEARGDVSHRNHRGVLVYAATLNGD